MPRPLNKLELGIIAQLRQGASFADLRRELGAKPAAIRNAIQALRWRGMIEWGRLSLPGQPEPEREPEPQPQHEPEPEAVVDPDTLTGCADDQLFAEVPMEAVRAVLDPPCPPSARKARLPLTKPEPATVFLYPGKPAPRAAVPAIGAVEPLPAEFRREALIAAKRRQTAYANRLVGKGKAAEVTRWEAEKAAADAARLADPLEQAKTRLRRRGFTVFAAEVTGGPKGKFYVGGRLMTEAELMAKAG